MKSIVRPRRERRAHAFRPFWVGVAAIVSLIAVGGCGKSYLQVNLYRPESFSQPAWVGVYFLSQESALDDKDNAQLSDPEGVPLGNGVVDKEVFAVVPGAGAHEIPRPEYNPQICFIVIAAGFPDADPCTRQKVPVKKGAELNITVTVNEKCIDLRID